MPKTTEPKIPDLPPGVPRDAEVQGDPGGGEGGGGGRRKMRDWSEGRTRRMLERSMEGSWRGSRRMSERSRAWSGGRRSMSERRREGNQRGTRSNGERRMAGRKREEPIVWRRSRDGIWRRSSESDKPNASQMSHDVVWRPWEQSDSGATIKTTVAVSFQDPDNIHQRLYFHSEEVESRGKILIMLSASLFDDEFLSLDRVDEKRFETASKVVQEINSLARQRPGDYFTSIKVPSDLSGSQCQCYLCMLGNMCLGPSCLGYSGKVENQVA